MVHEQHFSSVSEKRFMFLLALAPNETYVHNKHYLGIAEDL